MRIVACLSLAAFAWAAGAVSGAQSLAEAAAREKARRAAEKARGPAPPRVFTQEDLDKMEGAGRPNSAAASPTTEAGPSTPSRPEGQEPPPSPEGAEPGTEPATERNLGPEDEWRDRHREALAGLESARQNQGSADAEVERLKSDLNPMSTTFVTDPYAILEIQAKLTEAQARAAEARKQVDAAQNVVDGVVTEAKRHGVYLQ